MADEGSTNPVRETSSRRTRAQREAEVRRKYDFSVIRVLRQKKGLTIEKFAKLCGLSYAPISRIETNLIKPNLETLDKIAAGLGITTYNLVAMAERREAELREGHPYRAGDFELLSFSFDGLNVAYGTARGGAEADELDMRNQQFENLVVQSGCMEVLINGESHKLRAGESLQYDRIYDRHYRALEDSSFIVISHSTS
ncbi:MAG: helix-turn-helix domain-containing protein [Planctomycetes bacterium]|nr:helix-turn-helix domain-containing protein [Planctomycetota bacterium]